MTLRLNERSYLDLWYTALSTPFGVEIATSDFEPVRQALYRARVDSRDDDLKTLAVCQSPVDPTLLWIVRKEPSNASP